MAYFIDNEDIYCIDSVQNIDTFEQYSKFAFVLDTTFSELPLEQKEQLVKIVKSVLQEPQQTLFLLSNKTWTFSDTARKGVKFIVVFSSASLSVFKSLSNKKQKQFTIENIQIFVASALDIFQKSDSEKKALWAFMKTKI